MRTFRLTLCYDGSRYNGFQRQGNTDNTIQEKLETLLSRLLEQPVELAASGRTDAGVHARSQVCSFRADTEKDCPTLLAEIRRYLPEDIGAQALEEAETRFHARLSAREKTYVYRIWNSATPNVFQRRYTYMLPEALDVPAMEAAAAFLTGKHDFAAFCTKTGKKKSTVRTLRQLRITREGEELRLWFTGDGFLYNMVRILTGTLIEVGLGKRSGADLPAVLQSGQRSSAGFTAPAGGLTLWEVRYEGEGSFTDLKP